MAKKSGETEQQMILKGTEEAEILARLSERVERAIATIQELRRERDQLRTRAEAAEEALKAQGDEAQRLNTVESDYEKFRSERAEIRSRIETILGTLDSLDDAEGDVAGE